MSIPLSLYLHIPWCVKKCPYCDFNSHTINGPLPERDYVTRVLADLADDIARFAIDRPLKSIFIGGGTPSLFSGDAIAAMLDGIRSQIALTDGIEITLEANPGTVDAAHFRGYFRAGVNRLSIGVQSFNATQLQQLGRIHNPQDAERAIKTAQDCSFDNINIDLMFGLPKQTAAAALLDVEKALSFDTQHISYYQLTLEPNTTFAHKPPTLPDEESIDRRFDLASQLLHEANFHRYEVSAWHRGRQSAHNLNYWQYGDYLGIGAGAHGKITLSESEHQTLIRTVKPRSPQHYLASAEKDKKKLSIAPAFCEARTVKATEKPFEFMLNTLRLADGFERQWMAERGLFDPKCIQPIVQKLIDKDMLIQTDAHIKPTPLGYRFVNEMVEAFL